jgi:protein-S-isoprenylcysteine O-methyltransferase Ste14
MSVLADKCNLVLIAESFERFVAARADIVVDFVVSRCLVEQHIERFAVPAAAVVAVVVVAIVVLEVSVELLAVPLSLIVATKALIVVMAEMDSVVAVVLAVDRLASDRDFVDVAFDMLRSTYV